MNIINELTVPIVAVFFMTGIIGSCAYMNSGPCLYGNGDIVYRKLDGVRGIIVNDMGCHTSHRYTTKFTDSYYEQDITEAELQKTPELAK